MICEEGRHEVIYREGRWHPRKDGIFVLSLYFPKSLWSYFSLIIISILFILLILSFLILISPALFPLILPSSTTTTTTIITLNIFPHSDMQLSFSTSTSTSTSKPLPLLSLIITLVLILPTPTLAAYKYECLAETSFSCCSAIIGGQISDCKSQAFFSFPYLYLCEGAPMFLFLRKILLLPIVVYLCL